MRREFLAGVPPVLDLERSNLANALVGCRVVCERDARVLIVRQDAHASVPEAPKHFYGPIASRIVCQGCRRADACGLGKEVEGFGQELRGRVRVQDVRGSEHEDDPVEKRLEPRRRLAIRQRDDDHISGGWVDQGQGFGLTRECLALSLEIHAPPRSGCVGGQGREYTVGSVLSRLVDFARRAILQPLPNVTFLRRPKVRATDQSMHLGMGQVKHAFMGVATQRRKPMSYTQHVHS